MSQLEIMTEEQQRIAIAKAHLGKTVVEFRAGYTCGENECFITSVPNYLRDLNAMREAVMSLNSEENDRKGLAVYFCETLSAVLENSDCCWIECTIPQCKYLAKAFLITHGLWID